jgi:hypothetical protein
MILINVLIENRTSYFEDIYFLTMSKVRICTAGRVIACAMSVVHPSVRIFTVDMYCCGMFTLPAAITCSSLQLVRYLLLRGYSLVCKVYGTYRYLLMRGILLLNEIYIPPAARM